MPLSKKRPAPLRVAVFGDAKTFIPAIIVPLTGQHCHIIPIDSTQPPAAFRELSADLCIVELIEPAPDAHLFMRRIPADIPVIAVVKGDVRELEFAEIFDVLTLPLDTTRLAEDIDYLRSVTRSDALPVPPTDTELDDFSEFICEQCGLHFDRRNRKNLERGIQRRMRVVGAPTFPAYFTYLQRFLESRQELKKLVSLLTIGETSFFRFEPHFLALTERVIPELIRRNSQLKRLRIWSAGCSTGEEVYSLAITLLQNFPQLADWEITILGTDISHQSLAAARQGEYQERTLRNVTPNLLSQWFVKRDKSWRVSDRLRSLVNFTYLNLQSESYPHPKNGTTECDLIFCRNVMIYFRPETVRAVVSRMRRALRPGGYLFLGHSETLGAGFLDFVRCQHQGGTYYRAGVKDEEHLTSTKSLQVLDENKNKPQFILFENSHKNSLFPERPKENPEKNSGIISADKVNNKTTYPKIAEPVTDQIIPASDLLNQGFSLADQGRFNEALALCERALQQDDLSSRGYFLRGLIRDQQGESLAAIADYQRAILLNLKAVMAHYYLAGCCRRSGRIDEARRELQTTLRLLSKMEASEPIPDAKDWTANGLIERCKTELRQIDSGQGGTKD